MGAVLGAWGAVFRNGTRVEAVAPLLGGSSEAVPAPTGRCGGAALACNTTVYGA
jgi:hypothetical protein